MSPRARVRRARRHLAGAVILAALLWAATLAMAVVTAAAMLSAVTPLPAPVRAALIPLAVLAALGAAGVVLWRGRAARSLERVALWIEERDPHLRYALVTAIDPAIAPAARHPELHAVAEGVPVERIVRRAWGHALGRAALGCAVLAAMLLILQPRDLLRQASGELASRAHTRPPAAAGTRLAKLSARVVPPAYSRLPARTVDEPSTVAALVGSRVTLDGVGEPVGITAGYDSVRVVAAAGERGWAVALTMPRTPAVVTLRDRAYTRLLALEPRVDSAPDVRLRLPLRDTTYETVPAGRIAIEAELADDIGLDHGFVEYMRSTGSAESFETKVVNGPRIDLGNARTATLRAAIDLDTMKLGPGSVLHIRVIALDRNDVTGPGRGVSETRTLRIAERVDSTSINAAPPLPIDSMWISQRLLNLRTDTLIRDRRRLDHETFVHTSSGYGNAQEDIRKRTLAVIGLLEDNGVGGSFQTEISTKLREAAELMWTAREELSIARPDSARPSMRRILAILDEIRLANRYYLRGLLRPEVVNIARVRLTGTDSTRVGARTPRAELPDARRALARRLDAAASLAPAAPAAAADSLVYLRVAALGPAPAVAGVLQRAIDLLRRGAPADTALARARRALEPPPELESEPGAWGGVLP